MDEGETIDAAHRAAHEQVTDEAASPLRPPHATEGQLLAGRYRLLERIGAGGMGVVFRAHDVEADREVAIKLLTARDLSPAQAERFRREGQLAAAVKHPGVVRVHASGIGADGRPYLVSELVEGVRTLAEVLPEVDLHTKVDLIRQAADALGAAHRAGIVHRDVKPDNLLVDGSNRVRVTDFGAALQGELERLTLSGATVGTPAFMAPEQLDAARDAISPRTDVWALGVILYEAVCGVPPFPARSLIELCDRVGRGRFESPAKHVPGLSPALAAAIRRCLSLVPAGRYPDGSAVAAALGTVFDPSTWSSLTLDTLPQRNLRRLGWVFASLACVALLLASFAVYRARTQTLEHRAASEAIAWRAEVLEPWAWGLGVSPPRGPSLDEVQGWRTRLAGVRGEHAAEVASLRLELAALERLLTPASAETKGPSNSSVYPLVADALILLRAKKSKQARAVVDRALGRDPSFVPAQLLQLRVLSEQDPAGLVKRITAAPLSEPARALAATFLVPLAEQEAATALTREDHTNAARWGALTNAQRALGLPLDVLLAAITRSLERSAPGWPPLLERASRAEELRLLRCLAPFTAALGAALGPRARGAVERPFARHVAAFLNDSSQISLGMHAIAIDEVLTYRLRLPGRGLPSYSRLLRSLRIADRTRDDAQGRLRYHMAVLRAGLPMWASNLVKTAPPGLIQEFLQAHPESQAARLAVALHARLAEDGANPKPKQLLHALQGKLPDLAPIYLGELHYWRAWPHRETNNPTLFVAAKEALRLLEIGDEQLRQGLGQSQRSPWLFDLPRWLAEAHARLGDHDAEATTWLSAVALFERRLKRLGPNDKTRSKTRSELAAMRWSAAQALARSGARARAIELAKLALVVFEAENVAEAADVRAFLTKTEREAKRD